jgi:hypothetical protein
MIRLLTFLRSLIWTSVLSVVAIVAAIIATALYPEAAILSIVLAVSAVALAILSKD